MGKINFCNIRNDDLCSIKMNYLNFIKIHDNFVLATLSLCVYIIHVHAFIQRIKISFGF